MFVSVTDLRYFKTNLSKTFITTDVRATGRKSFNVLGLEPFGIGTMIEDLKGAGTDCSSSELLNISVRTGANCSAQCFKVEVNTPSGPGAFFGF